MVVGGKKLLRARNLDYVSGINNQHVFGSINNKIPAKFTVLIFKILFKNLYFH